MKRILLVIAAACLTAAMYAGTVNYTADNTTIFPNPERGFITMLERHANKRYAVKGKESSLTNLKTNDKGTLVLVLYYLDEFKNKGTLPDTILSSFDEDMAVLRNYGMKCILRFAYTNESYEKVIKPGDTIRTAADAPLEIIKQHLDQYKSHWQANADVIFCFQAGFVGQYGEWYYTDNFGNKADTINSERKAFMDTLLKATPQNRFVMLRTPLFKTGYLDSISVSSAALTAEEAYKPTAKARLGQHNDAFLNGPKNQGTYKDTATQKPWLAQETLYVPIGGECNITKQDTATKYASYEATTAEMSRLHWTFIQSGYAETTTNMWRNNGTFAELNRRLGYRFQLVNGTYGEDVTLGDDLTNKLSVNIQLKNLGFAPLYNERHAYIVLKNENATYPLQLSVDPRTWKPGSSAYTINQTLTVPNSVYNGTYDLYLWLPDEYASLRDKPAYAIRLANADVWDSETGFNALGAQVVVSGGSDAPEPEDTSIHLPDTLRKANYAAYGGGVQFSGDTLDYSHGNNHHRDGWVDWEVTVDKCVYNLTTNGRYTNGHNWKVYLISGSDTISTCNIGNKETTGIYSESATWNLSDIASAGIYTIRVKNIREWSDPKLVSLAMAPIIVKYDANGGICDTDSAIYAGSALILPTATKDGYALLGWYNGNTKIGIAGGSYAPTESITLVAKWAAIVNLPNSTLTKENVAEYSSDMTWYAEDPSYFDFGPTDSQNITRWATWAVRVVPGEYTISCVVEFGESSAIGWDLKLFNGADEMATYSSVRKDGYKSITYDTKWDLTKDKENHDLEAGVYILEVKNNVTYAQPKLKSLTLTYNGVVPTGFEETEEVETDGQMYDILGRPVDESYRGVIIMRGKKILR